MSGAADGQKLYELLRTSLEVNHALRVLYYVPRHTTLIQIRAMVGSLDLVATP